MPLSLNRRRIETAIAALVAVAAGIVGIATRESTRSLGPKFVKVDRIARLKEPVYLTQPPGPGSQLYIVQRQGTVRVLSPDRLLAQPFLKISDLVKQNGGGADGGMTSMAFPPDYRRTGLFYVAYTDRRDRLVVARYSRSAANPLVADRASGQAVLTIPESRPERHGGFITFGPDGDLFVGTGDGSAPGDPRGVAQDPRQLRGKILRIDPAGTGTPEIWATGLGDPRRISFDRDSHTVGIADVGDHRYEEIE
jgi:glucose/arabinose dehydrogenase